MLTQKLYLFPLSFLLLFVFAGAACKKTETNALVDSLNTSPNTSPNIVFIIADDMGWDAYGNYPGISSMKANTPTLDSLARAGITFTNFWTYPECSPTRASMLTGKYGFRTGVGTAGGTLSSNETIIQKFITDKTGDKYSNALIGKWHVSGGTNLTAPEGFGVQYLLAF